tara:strand:- start:256 stop:465 length:210 start_codon:yes stop_codon:yes gene_type:complete
MTINQIIQLDQLEMLTAREQLMEDIDCIVGSVSSQYIDHDDIEWNTIEIDHEDLIRRLCDAVCKNFPTN